MGSLSAFDVDALDTARVTDITYITALAGWLYLAVILTLFSRRVATTERLSMKRRSPAA